MINLLRRELEWTRTRRSEYKQSRYALHTTGNAVGCMQLPLLNNRFVSQAFSSGQAGVTLSRLCLYNFWIMFCGFVINETTVCFEDIVCMARCVSIFYSSPLILHFFVFSHICTIYTLSCLHWACVQWQHSRTNLKTFRVSNKCPGLSTWSLGEVQIKVNRRVDQGNEVLFTIIELPF